MLGCRRWIRSRSRRQPLCASRYEFGMGGGWPGALAEQLRVPASSLHALPVGMDPTVGALVEPGGNAWRAVDAAKVVRGERLLVIGPGAIGLLCAEIAAAAGVEVHLLGRSPESIEFARSLGFDRTWSAETLPTISFDAVIDASTGTDSPARALDVVEPGRRVVYIGLSGQPSAIDSRRIVLKDVTAVGILSA